MRSLKLKISNYRNELPRDSHPLQLLYNCKSFYLINLLCYQKSHYLITITTQRLTDLEGH